MSMNAKESYHDEHKAWKSDFSAWMADVEKWRAEYRHIEELVEEAMRNHRDALTAHVAGMDEVEQARKEHEHALATEAQGRRLADGDDLDVEHGAYGSRHDRQSDAHARMSRHHRAIMVAFENLKSAFAASE
jgi:hypothetical protein